MKNEIKLIACDLDKTLLDGSGNLPEGFGECLNRLKEHKIAFAVASGRPYYTVLKMFREWENDIYIVSDNGAAITFRGENLYKSVMSFEDILKMSETARKAGNGIPVLCGLKKGIVASEGEKFDDIFRIFFTEKEYTDDLSRVKEDIIKFTLLYHKADAKYYWDNYFAPEWGDKYNITLGSEIWIDIMNTGINKGSGMERMGDILGIGPENIMAFGDFYNDIEMLRYVGHPVIMENAPEELKKEFPVVAPPHTEAGVLRVINDMLDKVQLN